MIGIGLTFIKVSFFDSFFGPILDFKTKRDASMIISKLTLLNSDNSEYNYGTPQFYFVRFINVANVFKHSFVLVPLL